MIRFTANGSKHQFDEDRLTFGEARALEKVCGYPFKDLGKHLQSGEMTSLQAVIWVAMKRGEPTLKFSDLDDMSLADIEFEDGDDDEPDPTGGGASSSPAA